MSVRPSLADPALDPVWRGVRNRLERSGLDNRGRIHLPELPARARRVLFALVDQPPAKTLDLASLEAALAKLGVGNDLASALAALGHPVSPEPARRRAARRQAADTRAQTRNEVDTWPEPWAAEWIDEVIRTGHLAGLQAPEAQDLVSQVRKVLDAVVGRPLNSPATSRTDLAASVLGSSHALDNGTRTGSAVTRALRRLVGDHDGDDLWESVGTHTDLVSGPALTWGLVLGDSPIAELAATATAACIPLHISQLALRRHPVAAASGTEVLVVENPRLVEAAAQRGTPRAVVSTNGNPSATVRLLIDQLLEHGAVLRYHGDFDAPGLAICARMHDLGLRPWRMSAEDYLAAVATAVSAGVALPVDDRPVGPTPWDPGLRRAFESTRSIVHQERLLDSLLS